MWNESPVQIRCMIQDARGWCTGMTQRDRTRREVGGGFRMGNTCTPVVDSCQCMAKPRQYCKVINLQIKENGNLDYGCEDIFLDSQFYPIDLHVYSYTINPLFWWLWLFRKSWSMIVWVFQLYFSFSRLFWPFCVPNNSTWTSGFTFQFLDKDCIEFVNYFE